MSEHLRGFSEYLVASREAREARGVENPCPRCGGLGKRSYADTTTWRGGCGGQEVTADICDKCWGSGEAAKPWTNLRLVQSLLESHRDLRRYMESRALMDSPYPGERMAIERAIKLEAALAGKMP